jgi:hypothetical protein
MSSIFLFCLSGKMDFPMNKTHFSVHECVKLANYAILRRFFIDHFTLKSNFLRFSRNFSSPICLPFTLPHRDRYFFPPFHAYFPFYVQSVRNFTPENFPRILVRDWRRRGWGEKKQKNCCLIGFKLVSRCTSLSFPAAEKLPFNSKADRTKLNRFKTKKKKENNRDPAFSSHVGFVDNREGDFRLGLFSCSFSPQISRLT